MYQTCPVAGTRAGTSSGRSRVGAGGGLLAERVCIHNLGMIEGKVVVSKKGEDRALRGHPWIFRSDVTRSDAVPDGAVVKVYGPRGRPLGFAFFSSRSEIRLRVLERDESLTETFVEERLDAALRWREQIAPELLNALVVGKRCVH